VTTRQRYPAIARGSFTVPELTFTASTSVTRSLRVARVTLTRTTPLYDSGAPDRFH